MISNMIKIKETIKEIFLLIILVLASFFFLYRAKTPIAYITNWDWLHHISLIRQIINGKFNLLLTNISDTFTVNSYPPVFHLLISIPTVIFRFNLLRLFWWLELFHYLFTTFVSYWMGRQIFKQRWGGLITALLSMLIFESTVVYTNLFLLPQTIAGVFGALFLIYFIANPLKLSIWKFISSVIFVLMFHYLIGIIYLLLISLIYFNFKIKSVKFNKLLMFCSAFFLIISFILALFNQKIVLSNRPDAQHFIYNGQQLITLFNQWYGFLPLVFIPLGIYKLIKKDHYGKLVIFLFFLTGALSILPFSYSLKIYVLGRYFTNLIIAGGILKIIENINQKYIQILANSKKEEQLLKKLGLFRFRTLTNIIYKSTSKIEELLAKYDHFYYTYWDSDENI